eukprot:Hpha_TRINITY_DN16732_c2_g2::TRINITY_DN16732_c2_g2_i3::g.76855::m.76855
MSEPEKSAEPTEGASPNKSGTASPSRPTCTPEPAATKAEGKVMEAIEAAGANDLNALKELVDYARPETQELIRTRFDRAGVRGTLLCHAAYHQRRKTADYLINCPGAKETVSEAVVFCARHCKYDMALFLLSKPVADVNWQRPTDGNTLLHCICARPKPPVSFIAELCRLRILRVNTLNYSDQAPIHLLAIHSKGVEGRDAAQLLRAKGALLDVKDGDGRTPLELCKNSFLREVLCMSVLSIHRQDPSASLTEEDKQRIDALSSERAHKEVDKLLREAAMAKEQLKEEAFLEGAGAEANRRRKKKIGQEDVETLVSRLYTQTLEKQEENRMKKQKELEREQRATKKLDPSEQSESVERLHGQAALKQETMAALVEKYVEPAGEPKSLSPEDLADSISRLYNQSLEKKEEKRKQLRDAYLPSTLVEKKCGGGKIGKEGTAACVNRLYDESRAKQSQNLDNLRSRYLRTSPKHVISAERLQKSVEKLSSRN